MNENLLSLVNSDWRPTNNYPTLKGKAKVLSFDLETHDPNLLENGPGALRKDGYVIGFSIATEDGFKGYYPIRHESDNVDNPQAAVRWLKEQLNDNTPKIGANILYDMVWAKCDLGVDIAGPKWDVQIAEPLIDENQATFKLDALGVKWLNEHKDHRLLLECGKFIFGFKPQGKGDPDESVVQQVKGCLRDLPARYVGAYGEKDADLPIRIFEKQKVALETDGLWKLFELEAEVLDLLFEMQMLGVRVDVEQAHRSADLLEQEYIGVMKKLRNRCGLDLDIWSGDSIEEACKKLGLPFGLTTKGNPTFQSEWLLSSDSDFLKMIAEARSLDRSGSVFIRKKIIDLNVHGRIHPQFWQVKNDSHGTVAGRFSSSNPNAQQFPARNERMAEIVRGLIIPEEGCELGVCDYNQQEPRVTIHYGYVSGFKGAEEARQKFLDNNDTDYHQMTADMASIERKPAKIINLGLTYGMGKKKLAEKLGISLNEAYALFDKYHAALPYVGELTKAASRLAASRGYVKTLLGRRRHFDLWGPPKWTQGLVPKKYDEALKTFGRPIQRYFLHKALNSVVQGSSADMIKVALVLCRRAGFVPHLTVHDENDYSFKSRSDAKIVHDIMVHETADYLKLTVPLKVDVDLGKDWGHCEKVELIK